MPEPWYGYNRRIKAISLPDGVANIGYYAFMGCPGLTVKGYTGSYAETYAKNNNLGFEAPDAGPRRSDVNCDGTVDVKDSEKPVQYIARFLTADDLKQ